ncbi:unnamed protein product [Parnassius mnemosyne]|uniref:MADF domain-containing protein n=1 Tax=Parnassius mnemosyne TaxID=213953 RepID=A0AAV1LCF2_9NEOP
MKWAESETLKLVELYGEFPCIWDISHRDYKDKNKRNAAYEYIIRAMSKENFGVSELKQKIKNLRCTYNQERIKIKKSQKSGNGSNEVYVPSLKWYYAMDTLLKSITRSTETQDNFEGTIQSEKIESKKALLCSRCKKYFEFDCTGYSEKLYLLKDIDSRKKMDVQNMQRKLKAKSHRAFFRYNEEKTIYARNCQEKLTRRYANANTVDTKKHIMPF